MADNLNGGYNSSVAQEGQDLDVLLGKIKDATPATADSAGQGGLIPAPPAGSQDGSKVLNSKLEWSDPVSGNQYLDLASLFPEENGTLSDENYNKIVEAYNNNVSLAKMQTTYAPMSAYKNDTHYYLNVLVAQSGDDNVYTTVFTIEVKISDKTYIARFNDIALKDIALDLSMFSSTSGTLEDAQYQYIVDAYNNRYCLALHQGGYCPITIIENSGSYTINMVTMLPMSGHYGVVQMYVEVNSDKSYTKKESNLIVKVDYFNYLDFAIAEPNVVTTLANIPNKHNVIANVTAATDLSVSSDLKEGWDIQVRVNNTTASAITQTIPTTGSYDCLDGTSVEIPANGFIELNIWKINGINVIRVGQKQ